MHARYMLAFAALQTAGAQFVFDPKTYDSSQLFDLLSGYYEQYAATWENELTSAKASLPGAYSMLTSIFGTDKIPDSFDAGFASHLVSEMLEMGPTTILESGAAKSTSTDSSSSKESEQSTASHSSTESSTSATENTSTGETSSHTTSTSDTNIFTLTSGDTMSSGAMSCTRQNAFVTVAMAATMAGVGLFSFF
ncbi:hypothetical protein IW140_006335 [Coemansia sp. RSA 1813]|nr:hypothetical protein EV178_006311 [Coemansia sp. RSA 1646]KAJ1765909.1 hypothetical protein LPJ74_006150 [Coemansia sp. RSA 1843]KAJ2085503.1 hypothetical protein IW138_006286 [Coemansia sp. RSA 986]KAJ2210387.1 hypothetical protein EV179_006284 [Coemansia sp. RSA 487]KAJ2562738.1 hypothetical protein IW140_006335 [Coemansia sp. RSA 1813]